MKFSSVLNLESSPSSQASEVRHPPPRSSAPVSALNLSTKTKPSTLENSENSIDSIQEERRAFKASLAKHRAEIVDLSREFKRAFDSVVRNKDEAIATLTASLASAQDRIPQKSNNDEQYQNEQRKVVELNKKMESLQRENHELRTSGRDEKDNDQTSQLKELQRILRVKDEEIAQSKIELRAEIERANSLQAQLRSQPASSSAPPAPVPISAGDEKDAETIVFFEELTNISVHNVSVLRDIRAKTKQSIFDCLLTLEKQKRLALNRVDFVILDLADYGIDKELATKLASFADPNGIEFGAENMPGFFLELCKRVVEGADSDEDDD